MAGFVRRFGYFPGIETITQIEGVIVIDLPPPGNVQGVQSGVVGMVGEFPDMTYATAVDASGVVTTKSQPVEVTSGQDMIDKLGGFDSTIGNIGNHGGNGFVSLRNKKFSRLILAPINFASGGAGRAWRDLPTNLSATQAIPVVPLLGGRVEAGREFKSSTNRVHLAKRIQFTQLGHYANGIDGAVTSAGAAATQTLNSAGSSFLTAFNGGPVPKGAIVIVGVIGAAGAQGANALTLRVAAAAASNTALSLEKMDGSNFDWTTGTAIAFRIHPQTDADTGGTGGVNAKLSDVNGYTLPCRPLDATIAAATSLTPTVVPAASAATTWDPLSGLTLRSHQSSGFVYDATTQAPNATNHANIDALYATAFDGLAQDVSPARDVNIVFSSRTSSTIRNKVKSHALAVSSGAKGRIGIISPSLQTVTTAAAAIADTDPGVGGNRDERIIYCWPGLQTFVQEAANISLGSADGLTTTDGVLDTPSDGWMASILSNLAPELNPGQNGEPIDTILAPVLGIQRGVGALAQGDYINFRARGVAAPRIDSDEGPGFQSGITTSLTSGQKNIARRRMADFIQDSVSSALKPFSKKPLTTSNQDSATGEVDAFLNGLKSPDNPAQQRIVDYSVDDKTGNTPATLAQGIFVIIGRVRTLASMDFIVFQTEIGEGVVITKSLA